MGLDAFEERNRVAKRARNLWKRPNGSFRIGQRRVVETRLDEQRLTLYLPASILDKAEQQSLEQGARTLQDYCAALLRSAIEAEHSRVRLADAEAKRGALEGFRAITDDPQYLVEWSASALPREMRRDYHVMDGPPPGSRDDDEMSDQPSSAARVVIRHATSSGDDPDGFLATIRRGESIAPTAAVELQQALTELEVEYRDARSIPRRVAYALHRLAFEGQVLHTDAWPGALDGETVRLLRSVQEAVDRILSGEDIRYYDA